MKILQLVYRLSSGGAERFSVDLSNSLAEKGHEVVLGVIRDLSISENSFYLAELSENVRVENLKIGPGPSIRYLFEIWNLIKNEDPDIVHIHLDMYKYILPIPLFDKKRTYFQTIHNDIASINSKVERILSGWLFKIGRVKAVTISKETTRSFNKAWNFQPFAEVINGRAHTGPTRLLEDVHNEVIGLKNSSEDRVFLHVGRYSRQKNQELLVQSFNELAQTFDKYLLLIIGAGFDSVDADEIKQIANPRIKFLGERKNIVDYFLNADVFCLSSIYEGMPISLIEAYCYGCVPICTPVGGIIDTITDGQTGYLSKDISASGYLSALHRYLSNPDLLKRDDLHKIYSDHFSMGKCADGYIHAYQQALPSTRCIQ